MRQHPHRSSPSPWAPLLVLVALAPAGPPALAEAPPAAAAPATATAAERASAEHRAGRYADALQHWRDALASARTQGDRVAEAQASLGLGMAYLALGRYPLARDHLQAAAATGQAAGDPAVALRATIALGTAHYLAGEPEAGREALERAGAQARAAGRTDLAATATVELGNLLARQGERDPAASAYRSALRDLEPDGDRALAARAAVNLARVLGEGRDPRATWTALEAARARVEALPAGPEQVQLLLSLGRLYAQVGGPGSGQGAPAATRARTAFERAAALAEHQGDARSLSYALGYLGEQDQAEGRRDDALRRTRQAALRAAQANAPEALYRWQWQTARLLRAAGDRDGAAQSYEQAIATLEGIRQDLTARLRDRPGAFRAEVGQLYLEHADLLLTEAAAAPSPAASRARLARAREVVELLKGAELEDYFQDDCVAALRSKTSGIDQVAERTAAIYPILLPDRVEVLLSLAGGIRRYQTPVEAERFANEVRTLRQLLEKRTTHQYLPHARQVYDWLMRPLEADLRAASVDTLVIVPDGVLRTIPLAALHDGQDFLVARYALATVPALTLTDPRPIRREGTRVLLSGLTEPVQGFPPLPAVAQELQAIHALYGGTVLENDAFRAANVQAELTGRPYSVVHVASHGRFEPEASETFLLTYDGRITMDALEGYLGVTALRDQPVELLTLSACQTAAGDERAALGLAGVAVKAGARSALATLWSVNDQSSSMLVTDFYRRLQDPQASKAEALRQAQLGLMQDRRYRHPAYWAAFLVIGNWL